MAAVTASQTVAAASSIVSKSAFTGRSIRGTKISCAPRRVSLAIVAGERPLFFPGNPAPAYLDGSLPADYGFDPLELGSVPSNLKWYVQAELVHCRWAMLGAAGVLIPDLLRVAGILDIPRWDIAGVSEYAIDTPTLFGIELLLVGFAEGKRWQDINAPGTANEDPIFKGNAVKGTDVGYPGFDPLGMGSGETAAVRALRTKEIANGRLAMLAFLGFSFQTAYTNASPVENLLSHLADPFHNNFVETFFS